MQSKLREPCRGRELSPSVCGSGSQREDGGRVDAVALGRKMERFRVRRDPLGSGIMPYDYEFSVSTTKSLIKAFFLRERM